MLEKRRQHVGILRFQGEGSIDEMLGFNNQTQTTIISTFSAFIYCQAYLTNLLTEMKVKKN